MKSTPALNIDLLNADIYRLIANCFDFPNQDRLFAIKEMAGGLCKSGHPNPEIANILTTLCQSINDEEILYDYSLIFIKGGVPLSETHTLQRYNSVTDVNAFYYAFGFQPKTGENPDSIMYELEFLAMLLLKAVIAPNEEAQNITQKAYQDFLIEHTAEFAISLAQKIREGNAGTFFFTVSFLLETFIRYELDRNHLTINHCDTP